MLFLLSLCIIFPLCRLFFYERHSLPKKYINHSIIYVCVTPCYSKDQNQLYSTFCRWRLLPKPTKSNFCIDRVYRRKIRLIEGNAKCRYLKKFTCKGTLRQVFICLRPRTPYPPYTQYTCILYVQYTYSHGEGGGGVRELNQREG